MKFQIIVLGIPKGFWRWHAAPRNPRRYLNSVSRALLVMAMTAGCFSRRSAEMA